MRVEALDHARGVLMLYIVAVIHGLFWLKVGDEVVISWLLFEMPVVFAISGYTLALQRGITFEWTREAYFHYVRARLQRILIPYLAYAFASAVVVFVVRAGLRGEPLEAAPLLLDWMNPLTHGDRTSVWMLATHLWFIPVFVFVSVLMPVFSLPFWLRIKPQFYFFLMAALMLAWGLSPERSHTDLARMIPFYLFWAGAGYLYERQGRAVFTPKVLVQVLLGASAALATLIWVAPTPLILSMQSNKFPPNAAFFFFTTVWSAALILTFTVCRAGSEFFSRLARLPVLLPFVKYGYSIYLWQGIGFSAAIFVGERLGLAVGLRWALALALSMVLGRVFSPIERWRWW